MFGRFDSEYSRGWHLWGPFTLGAAVILLAHPAPESVEGKALLCWGLSLSGVWWWQINAGIVIRKWRDAKDSSEPDQRPEPEPKAEPVLEPGMKPFIRLNGKSVFASTTLAVKMDKERHVAITLIRQRDNGFAFDLTEETWARNKGKKKKFMTRSELNAMKIEWERHSLICRTSGAKNAPYDAYRWEKIEDVARGHPLPR